jgi:hypothetical protein
MKRSWTDAEYEVVQGPEPRVELPAWFKVLMLGLVALMFLALPIWRWHEAHPTEPPAGAAPPPAAPQSPAAR